METGTTTPSAFRTPSPRGGRLSSLRYAYPAPSSSPEHLYRRSPVANLRTSGRNDLSSGSVSPPCTKYRPKHPEKHRGSPLFSKYSDRSLRPITVPAPPSSPGFLYNPNPKIASKTTPAFSFTKAGDLPSLIPASTHTEPATPLNPNYSRVSSRLDTHTPVIPKTIPHDLDEYLLPKRRTHTELSDYTPTPSKDSCPAMSLVGGGEARGEGLMIRSSSPLNRFLLLIGQFR
ncbi:hypothetical protein GEMRC1_010206 [Eukaryota sp. GEM-RC1]